MKKTTSQRDERDELMAELAASMPTDRVGLLDLARAAVAELQSQIKQHSPGDVVVFRVVPASTSGPTGSSQTTGTGPATERSITVTLGAVAPSV